MDGNRVVLINGNNSEWYEQVIFILKSPSAAKTKNLVFEAEKIINDYMLSGKITRPGIERYKESIAARAASAQNKAPSGKTAVRAVHEPDGGGQKRNNAKKTIKRKPDYTSFLINVCLVLASILLGYIMHRVMGQ